MVKYSDELMVTKVFVHCIKKPRSISDLSRMIYNSNYAKNQIRIFQTVEELIGEGILVPKVLNGKLMFQIDKEIIKDIIN